MSGFFGGGGVSPQLGEELEYVMNTSGHGEAAGTLTMSFGKAMAGAAEQGFNLIRWKMLIQDFEKCIEHRHIEA